MAGTAGINSKIYSGELTMETIRTYLDNLFAAYTPSARMQALKEELQGNMEEKYRELKAQGRTENEAIGIVIAEFGSIDELAAELEAIPQKEEPARRIDREEAAAYLQAKGRSGRLVALGVMLCILAPAALIALSLGLWGILGEELAGGVGVCVLLCLIALGVGLFIYCDVRMKRYEYIEKEQVNASGEARALAQATKEQLQGSYMAKLIAGVVLCILGPAIMILLTMMTMGILGAARAGSMATCLMLCLIALGVFLLIDGGVRMEGCNALLETEDFSREHKEGQKAVGKVAAVIWPLVVVVFLLWGFLGDGWKICWIVFPVTGILQAGFCRLYEVLKKEKQ
jgi:hypothetical protein